MKIKAIQDFFTENYATTKPEDEIIEAFFKDEIAFRPVGKWYEDDAGDDFNQALDTATSFKDSGTLDLVINSFTILENDPHWVIISDYESDSLRMIMKMPQVPDYYLIIKNLRVVLESAAIGISTIPTLHQHLKWVSSKPSASDELGFEGIKEWENNGVPGCWFDIDGNKKRVGWNCTDGSKFLKGQIGFGQKNYLAYLVEIDEIVMGNILNWMIPFYESLFKIIGVKV